MSTDNALSLHLASLSPLRPQHNLIEGPDERTEDSHNRLLSKTHTSNRMAVDLNGVAPPSQSLVFGSGGDASAAYPP